MDMLLDIIISSRQNLISRHFKLVGIRLMSSKIQQRVLPTSQDSKQTNKQRGRCNVLQK